MRSQQSVTRTATRAAYHREQSKPFAGKSADQSAVGRDGSTGGGLRAPSSAPEASALPHGDSANARTVE
eukprot:1188718-Prorocentrum_minimum.AAC.9